MNEPDQGHKPLGRRLLHLWWVDLRQGWRDPLTSAPLTAPLALAVALRFGYPPFEGLVLAYTGFDLSPYAPAAAGLVALLIPMVFGMVTGFLMLDEKDEGTLVALQVTPLSRRTYLIYRAFAPVLLAALATLLVLPVTAITPIRPLALAGVSLTAALGAPLFAFVLVQLTGNKIEGLAVAKLLSVTMVVPIASLFLPGLWVLALGVVPQFWPFHLLVRSVAGAGPGELVAVAAGGVVVQAIYLGLLVRGSAR